MTTFKSAATVEKIKTIVTKHKLSFEIYAENTAIARIGSVHGKFTLVLWIDDENYDELTGKVFFHDIRLDYPLAENLSSFNHLVKDLTPYVDFEGEKYK